MGYANLKIKPTKKLIKITLAAVLFSVVLIKYNQQRPTLKTQAPVEKQTEVKPVEPATEPVKPEKSLPSTKSTQTVQKEIAPTNPIAQKRYYLLDTPNDTYYASTWYMQRINAPAAWNITNSSSEATIAVIDSGFALNHQDLSNQWQFNTGEYGEGKESDGLDNDENGYTDDYRGWDFANGDNLPQAGTLNGSGAGVSHGTEVAGLSGARSNNGLGVASVARNVKLLPLQVMDDNGNGYSSDVAQAIIYAIDQGADVINMSLGTSGDDPIVRAAVDIAFQHNVVVVAAAGNCGTNSGGPCAGQSTGYITFPANYNRVIAVGATDSSNNRANFSSYGERLDIMAPGSGSLLSTTWSASNSTSLYASTLYGTSYASPIVASSVALIRSLRPYTSVDDVRALLMGGVQKLGTMGGSFYTQQYGHGLLDIGKAVLVASELNTSGEGEPALQQNGGSTAEHIYASSDILGAACVSQPATWCSVWIRNDLMNYERFLPYLKTSSEGLTSWGYHASGLNKGHWSARARQGDTVSATPYDWLKK